MAQTVMAEQPVQPGWRDWIILTKPRIVMSNLITAWAGFFLAVRTYEEWTVVALLWMTVGAALVMASGCVFNNYLDREMDQRMARTQHRALPMQRVSATAVSLYGFFLLLLGLVSLALVNILSVILGVIGWASYVWLYTYWLKRNSTLSTVWGGVAGSIPPVIGYAAVSAVVDLAAVLLFMFLFLWQPPHFLALAIRRKEEYRAAGFPLLPVVKSVAETKIQMIRYLAGLLPVSLLFYGCGYAGPIYLIAAIVLWTVWMIGLLQGFRQLDDTQWSKRWFFFSIWYLTILSILLMFA